MARKGDYLGGATLNDIEHIGLAQAEHDLRLNEYYVGRDYYLERALNMDNPTAVYVGPKGIGKSAILQMIRIERESEAKRIIDISPDDLAFTALANIEYEHPLLSDAERHQHLYRTLWDYVLTLEVAKREYKNDRSQVKEFLRRWTRTYDEKVVNRLLEKSLGDATEDLPLSKRILALVSEFEANIATPYMAGGASVSFGQPASDSPTSNQLSLLSLINDAVKALSNDKVIRSPYYILIDDLDHYYRGTESQNAFIGALLLSINRLARSSRLKFAVSLRDYIFEAVPFSEKDKYRDYVCMVEWDNDSLKEMLNGRIKTLVKCPEQAIWRDLFPPRAFHRMRRHTRGMPREMVRLCSLILASAKRRHQKVVADEDITAGIKRFSQEELANLASEYSQSYPGLDLIANRFRKVGKEFTFDGFLEIALDVAESA